MDFDKVLPRLAATYESGRLVPFIGSGMSLFACTDWAGLVGGLEREAGQRAPSEPKGPSDPAAMIRRAQAAVRSLKSSEPGRFARAMRKAVVGRAREVPPQTEALARIWWPLVLTTNYDNCFAAAFQRAFPDRLFSVVGRGPEDCQRVLNSLTSSGRTLLWALQGYLDTPCKPWADAGERRRLGSLAGQLVVGHEEYRRVTYRDLHFRRAFAEVFRQRSLLFLGSGIRENYLQELFGEVLETYGPTTRPHYAFVHRDDGVDVDFMMARFQIVVVEYDDHAEVPRRLGRLHDEIHGRSRAALSWSWGRSRSPQEEPARPELEIVRGSLPLRPARGECLAVSAGGGGDAYYFTAGIARLMKGWGVKPGDRPQAVAAPYLARYPRRHVYAVRARDEKDERALSHIHRAALALFRHAAPRYRCIRLQLLAAGGLDKAPHRKRWKVRPYPERFSFVQIVTAWGEYLRTSEAACTLAVHVVSEPVYREVASGRLDVMELLTCEDVRFWAEVVGAHGEFERRLFQEGPQTTLRQVVDALHLSPKHWTVEVSPATSLDARNRQTTVSKRSEDTLREIGVVAGSTLHFRRPRRRSSFSA